MNKIFALNTGKLDQVLLGIAHTYTHTPTNTRARVLAVGRVSGRALDMTDLGVGGRRNSNDFTERVREA